MPQAVGCALGFNLLRRRIRQRQGRAWCWYASGSALSAITGLWLVPGLPAGSAAVLAAWVVSGLALLAAAERATAFPRVFSKSRAAGSLACLEGLFALTLLLTGHSAWLPWLAVAALLRLVWVVVGYENGILPGVREIAYLDAGLSSEVAKRIGEDFHFVPLSADNLDAELGSFPDLVVVEGDAEVQPAPLQRLLRKWQGVPVYDAAGVLETLSGRVAVMRADEEQFLGPPVDPRRERLQRALDVGLTVLVLPLVLPLMFVITLLIRLDSKGPALYFQPRVGRNGEIFEMVKLRTMTVTDQNTPTFTSENDPRLTRVGRLLRGAGLDEIPQLWNVLCGEMSLVGPRPEQVKFVEHFERELPLYAYRHRVRPGITGWAQVQLGYVDTVEGTLVKLEHDLFYLKRASLGFDLAMLVQTLPVLAGRRMRAWRFASRASTPGRGAARAFEADPSRPLLWRSQPLE